MSKLFDKIMWKIMHKIRTKLFCFLFQMVLSVRSRSQSTNQVFSLHASQKGTEKMFCKIRASNKPNRAIRDTFLCFLMPVPSPDKWRGLGQEGYPA